MTPSDAGAYAARLERVRTASLHARQAKADPPESASVEEDAVASVDENGVDELSPGAASVEEPEHALIASVDGPVDLPPAPVVLVRRLDEAAAPPPMRQNGKRLALGIDPLEDIEIPRGLKSSIERVVGGLAERRDDE